jgi:hypothetical protein
MKVEQTSEFKEASWWFERHWYEIHIMWIPSHVGVMGNERADRLAGEAVQAGWSLLLLSGLLISDLCQERDCWTVGSVAGAGVGWLFDFAFGVIGTLV